MSLLSPNSTSLAWRFYSDKYSHFIETEKHLVSASVCLYPGKKLNIIYRRLVKLCMLL